MIKMKLEQILLLLFVLIFLVACGKEIETNMSEPMVEFDFTTQDDEKLNLKDLQGVWWIANFMYTNCSTICPRTTAHLADVQQTLKKDDLHPHIVSFSVDPSYDTPDILTEYAKTHDADLETWSFLTGYDFETIQDISEQTFKTALKEGAADQRSHGFSFFLINAGGNIVKKYDGLSQKELDILIDDLRTVL